MVTLVAFAAAPGTAPWDGGNLANSRYTKHLPALEWLTRDAKAGSAPTTILLPGSTPSRRGARIIGE